MFKFIKKIFKKEPDYIRMSTIRVFRDSSEVSARLITLSKTRAEIIEQEEGSKEELLKTIDEQIKTLCGELGTYEYATVSKKFILRIAKKTFESCAK